MATGTDTYQSNAVPLLPSKGFAIDQQTAAGGADLATLSLGASATDDILVGRSGTTERFVVEDGGNVVITQGAAGDVGVKITQAASATAKAIVVETSANAETFSVSKDGAIYVTNQTAATVPLTLKQKASQSGNMLNIVDSSTDNLKTFHINSAGGIRTMVLSTIAIASLASDGSASYSVTGATTDDAVLMIPLKALTAADGILSGYVQGAARVDVYAKGASLAANTYAIWIFRTVAN